MKLLHKIAEEGTLLNSSSEATVTLIPKPDRYHTCKKKTTGKYNQYRGKNPEQNTSKPTPTIQKRIIHYDQVGFISGMQEFFNISKSVSVIYHINKLKNINHMIISKDAEKAFDNSQHPFWIKTLQRVTTEGTYRNIIKVMIYDKPTANITLNNEKLKVFPLRSGIRQGGPLSPLLFSIILEVLATAIRINKEWNPNCKKSKTVSV